MMQPFVTFEERLNEVTENCPLLNDFLRGKVQGGHQSYSQAVDEILKSLQHSGVCLVSDSFQIVAPPIGAKHLPLSLSEHSGHHLVMVRRELLNADIEFEFIHIQLFYGIMLFVLGLSDDESKNALMGDSLSNLLLGLAHEDVVSVVLDRKSVFGLDEVVCAKKSNSDSFF